jgi:hypothetical protein
MVTILIHTERVDVATLTKRGNNFNNKPLCRKQNGAVPNYEWETEKTTLTFDTKETIRDVYPLFYPSRIP